MVAVWVRVCMCVHLHLFTQPFIFLFKMNGCGLCDTCKQADVRVLILCFSWTQVSVNNTDICCDTQEQVEPARGPAAWGPGSLGAGSLGSWHRLHPCKFSLHSANKSTQMENGWNSKYSQMESEWETRYLSWGPVFRSASLTHVYKCSQSGGIRLPVLQQQRRTNHKFKEEERLLFQRRRGLTQTSIFCFLFIPALSFHVSWKTSAGCSTQGMTERKASCSALTQMCMSQRWGIICHMQKLFQV